MQPLGLPIRTVRAADVRSFVPVETKPPEAVENSGDHVRRRAFDVGVLDAKNERAAVATGVEPVEERRSSAADVQESCRRRREAHTWGHACIIPTSVARWLMLDFTGWAIAPDALFAPARADGHHQCALCECVCRRRTLLIPSRRFWAENSCRRPGIPLAVMPVREESQT